MKEYAEQLHINIKARLHVEPQPQGSYIIVDWAYCQQVKKWLDK
jgi:hypothetical protein